MEESGATAAGENAVIALRGEEVTNAGERFFNGRVLG